jgi:hypothetical protein
VLGVVDVRSLEPRGFVDARLLTAGRFKEVKVGMPTVSG